MKTKSLSIMALISAITISCSTNGEKRGSGNPLLEEPTAKYGIIDYDRITPEHFSEAIELGMEEQKREVKDICENPEEPTFRNTIAALDQSGQLLSKSVLIFEDLTSSNSTPELEALQTKYSPALTAHNDGIYLNPQLFDRVKTVYDKHYKMGIEQPEAEKEILNHEEMSVLRKTYEAFAKRGAELGEEQKAQLRELNARISALQTKFSQNLLHETNNTYVTVDSKEELDGLPEANIQRAADMARQQGQEGKYMFNMQRPSCNPVLQYCTNRELRHKVYDAYYNRGNQGNEWDNKAICAELVKLRLERAQLLGYKNCAEQILKYRMAENEENVYDLLNAVWGPAVEKANQELADIRVEMKKDGLTCEPEGWDYMFYSSRAKAAKYAIDEEKIAEYFEINNVLKGIFYVAEKLHGLTFKEITGQVPTYSKETQTWEVYDRDKKLVAIFYNDYFPRDGKGAGAWMTDLRPQSYVQDSLGNEVRQIPITINVCNMTRPNAEGAALQSIDNVTTMFHEFGHAMHFMLHDVHYNATYDVESDYVELPSQLNEHWATEPEVLKVYAKHYKTGEVIPMDLVKKLDESSKYGQGFATVEYLAASLVDMDLHTLTEVPEDLDVIEFETRKLQERGIPRQILPRYRVTNFSHTMGGGYTAGYYSYLWSEVLDCDAFEAFKETGDIFNSDLALHYRKTCLEPGGIDSGLKMYINFRGRKPGIEALLRNRGLSTAACR